MTKKQREQAEILKKIEKAFGRKQYIKSKVAPVYPMSAEREFRRGLRGYMDKIGDALGNIIKTSGGGKIDGAKGKSVIKNAVKNISLKSDIKKASDSVVAISLKEMSRSAQKTLGFDIKVSSSFFEEKVLDWDDRTEKALREYADTIAERVGKSTTEAQIRYISGIVKNGAKKMSRLTVTELNGAVSEQIQHILGNDRYVWATARDDRVRPCHRSFDGKTFFWNDPPEIWEMKGGRRVYTGRHCHPGQDYNCRCMAITVFDKKALLDFLKVASDEENTGKKARKNKK